MGDDLTDMGSDIVRASPGAKHGCDRRRPKTSRSASMSHQQSLEEGSVALCAACCRDMRRTMAVPIATSAAPGRTRLGLQQFHLS